MSDETIGSAPENDTSVAPFLARILVVDDEPDIRKLLSLMLEPSAGGPVDTASNAEEALERLEKLPYDLVISDIMMPGMDGTELLRRIKGDFPEVEVVLLTAHGSLQTAIEALKLNAFDYISKPVRKQKLIAVVRNALAKQRLARENQRITQQLLRFNEELQRRVDEKTAELRSRVQELEVLQKKSAALMENLPVGCLIFTEDGRVEQANERAVAIFGPEADPENEGEPQAGSAFSRICRIVALEFGRSPSWDHRLEIREGDEITQHLRIHGRNISFEHAPDLCIVLTEDTTERENLARMVRRKESLATVGGLAAGIAHEIKNPLGAIRGMGELLSMKIDAMVNMKRFSEQIMSEVDRLTQIVNNVVSCAKEVKISAEPYGINALLQECLTVYEGRENLRIDAEFDGEIPEFPLDHALLGSAIHHVLRNAAEAMPEGGTIHVRSRREGEEIRIAIRDDGPGQEPARLEDLFKPFYSTKKKTGGTGLGLTITRKIVEDHGGTIALRSAPKEGLTVEIRLPLSPGPAGKDVP